MGKLRFTFTNILLIIGVFASVLLFENLSFFAPNPENPLMSFGLDNSYFFIIFAIAMISFIALIVYDAIFNKNKVNVLVLVPVLIGLAAVLVGVWLFDGMSFVTIEPVPDLVIDSWNKIRHTLTLITYALAIYAIFTYFVNNNPSTKRLGYIFAAVIVFCLVISVYSVITEYSKYEFIANRFVDHTPQEEEIKSIFLNTNMFSGMLLMGVASSIALNYFKKNPLSYIGIFGLTIIQVFVNSISGSILTITLVAMYLLVEIIINFKKKTKRAFLELSIYVTLLVGITILFCLTQYFEIPVISNFCRFLYSTLSKGDFAKLSNRTLIWGKVGEFEANDPLHMILGYGLNNTGRIIGGIAYNTHSAVETNFSLSAHSGFVQLFVDFGIVGLAIYLFFIVTYFYCLIRLFRRHARFSLIFLIIGMTYFGYAISESIIAFYPSAQGMLVGILFYLPVINKYRHLKHQEVAKDVVNNNSPYHLLTPELTVRALARVFIALIVVTISFFAIDLYREDLNVRTLLLQVLSGLIILLLSVPYVCGLWSKTRSSKVFAINALISSLMVALPIAIINLLPLMGVKLIANFEWMSIAIAGLICAGLVSFYSVKYQGTVKLYLNTFIGFKTALGSILMSALFTLSLYFVKDYLILNSPLTVILIVISNALIYGVSTLIIPFKDIKEIVNYNAAIDLNYMKKHVIRDRLEEANEI